MATLEFMVGGWFASPIISRVVEKAQKYLSANKELEKSTQGLIETLTCTLVLIKATIEEAEKRMINNSNLAVWLRMLKEAVYDAEDVLDNMEAKSIKEKVQGKNKVSNFASSSLLGLLSMFCPDDNHKSLKKAVDRLSKLSADITNFVNLVNMNESYGSSKHEFGDLRETISRPLEEVGLHGREEELNLILEMILDSGSESSKKEAQNYNNYHGLFVIPIVGMGGVGKTALAQAVYNNPEVQQTFASKAWISVAYNLDIVLLMRKIIQSLGGYIRLDVITLEDVSKNLSSIVDGVRFLVVLDDMFEKIEYQWSYLQTTLSCGAPGSVVLITTQNQAFADRVGTFGHITLNPLESGIFWELFKSFAFGNLVMPMEKRKNLELIGKQIASKLRGLPLAAKIIGKLLRSNIDEDKWRRITKSEWWDIPECKTQILPSVGVGYEHLDPCLRQCFAYCSVFPRNSLIEKDRLVQMWIAQNFIPYDRNSSRKIEDIGRRWFDELVEMSFFQTTGDNKGYVIPELMHDLAVIVSSDECLYLGDKSVEIPQGVRHLAVDTKNLDALKGIKKHKHIRSFFYFGFCHVDGMYSTINEILSNLESIRVLDLSYFHMETKEPPNAIQNMAHLRFLDLSFTGIEVLTHSRFDHYHLQTLNIKKCQFLELPRSINKLINLRHLNADAETIALISGIGQLVNLQELDEYRVGKKEGHKVTELQNLREITGHLKVVNCENIKSKGEAVEARIVDKKNLDSVQICWSSTRRKSNIDMDVLEGLKPHDDINELTINSYMGRSFPNWMMEMSHFLNLQSIYLFACINIEVLPPLGQLPSLKHLQLTELNSMKMIDHHFYGNKQTVFPALTYFLFSYLTSCEEWTKQWVGGFFPHLSTLEIIHNRALREAPLQCFAASLKALKLVECSNLHLLEESLHLLTSLSLLHIINYTVSISLNPKDLRLLEDLMLRDCPELSIEGDLQSLTTLKRLEITNCPKLLSNSMHNIMSKQKGKGLQVHEGEGLQSLSYIEMDHSVLHCDYHLILGRLPSLRFLNCKHSEPSQFTADQTLWFQELTALQELTFLNCEFENLPSSLAMISSLKKLMLMSCTNLESLPLNGMPPFLRELSLMSCSHILVQRCQPNEGEDWQLISHVPLIRIDGRTINKPQSLSGTSG